MGPFRKFTGITKLNYCLGGLVPMKTTKFLVLPKSHDGGIIFYNRDKCTISDSPPKNIHQSNQIVNVDWGSNGLSLKKGCWYIAVYTNRSFRFKVLKVYHGGNSVDVIIKSWEGKFYNRSFSYSNTREGGGWGKLHFILPFKG